MSPPAFVCLCWGHVDWGLMRILGRQFQFRAVVAAWLWTSAKTTTQLPVEFCSILNEALRVDVGTGPAAGNPEHASLGAALQRAGEAWVERVRERRIGGGVYTPLDADVAGTPEDGVTRAENEKRLETESVRSGDPE